MVIYIFIYQTNTYTVALTLTLTLTLTLLLAIITAIQWKYNGALRKQWESTRTHVCCSKPPGVLSLEFHSSQGAAGQLLCGVWHATTAEVAGCCHRFRSFLFAAPGCSRSAGRLARLARVPFAFWQSGWHICRSLSRSAVAYYSDNSELNNNGIVTTVSVLSLEVYKGQPAFVWFTFCDIPISISSYSPSLSTLSSIYPSSSSSYVSCILFFVCRVFFVSS